MFPYSLPTYFITLFSSVSDLLVPRERENKRVEDRWTRWWLTYNFQANPLWQPPPSLLWFTWDTCSWQRPGIRQTATTTITACPPPPVRRVVSTRSYRKSCLKSSGVDWIPSKRSRYVSVIIGTVSLFIKYMIIICGCDDLFSKLNQLSRKSTSQQNILISWAIWVWAELNTLYC